MKDKTDNELIAEFMGGKQEYPFSEGWIGYVDGLPKPYRHSFELAKAEYSTSWNWLMPVVEKIEKTWSYEIDIYQNICEINTVDLIRNEGETKLDATYKSVVEWIKWYNKEKNQQSS